MASGRLDLAFQGKRLRGVFVLTRMKGSDRNWLLIKKRDDYADPGFRLQTVIAT